MDLEETFTKFPMAKDMMVYIDTISPAGSGFGVSDNGEQVFLNARLVRAVGLNEGDVALCQVISNYPDKQEDVPYRAVRAEVSDMEEVDQACDDDPLDEPDPEPTVKDRILQHLRDVGPTCTSTLAKALCDPSIGAIETYNLCASMHKVGTIARADVYRKAGQDRESMTVWALSATEFEVDQPTNQNS